MVNIDGYCTPIQILCPPKMWTFLHEQSRIPGYDGFGNNCSCQTRSQSHCISPTKAGTCTLFCYISIYTYSINSLCDSVLQKCSTRKFSIFEKMTVRNEPDTSASCRGQLIKMVLSITQSSTIEQSGFVHPMATAREVLHTDILNYLDSIRSKT